MAKKKKLGDRARAFVDDYTRDLTARDLQRVFTRETRDMVAFFTQGTDQAEVTQKDLLRHPFRHARQFFLAFAMRLTAARCVVRPQPGSAKTFLLFAAPARVLRLVTRQPRRRRTGGRAWRSV